MAAALLNYKPQNQCHRDDQLLYDAGVVCIYQIQFFMMIDSMLFYQVESIDDFRMWALIGSDTVLLLSGYAGLKSSANAFTL